jgi:hypothetical protein
MAHDVFISHAHKDEKFADTVCQKFESAGVRCWIAPRDIAREEDWKTAIQGAVGSSRVVILIFSNSTNSAPHIIREIANAYYTGRTIIALRLTKALPERDLLFYLGEASWFDAVNLPAERNLEALTARTKILLGGLKASGQLLSPQRERQKPITLSPVPAWKGEEQSAEDHHPRILKRMGMAASVVGVGGLLWFASRQSNENGLGQGGNLSSRDDGTVRASAGEKDRVVVSTPHYTFSRLGMWMAVNSSPSPAVHPGTESALSPVQGDQSEKVIPLPVLNLDPNSLGQEKALAVQENAVKTPYRLAQETKRSDRHRAKLRSKDNNRRAEAERLRFRGIKGWLAVLWRQRVERVKRTSER